MAHGVGHFQVVAPRSKFYHGPFGRLCGDIPGAEIGKTDAELEAFAREAMIEEPGLSPTDIAKDTGLTQDLEARFNSKIPAGYTYFGQFVDHDITFDPASSLMRQNDPNGLFNFRTPRLDLDNVYGRGPKDQPYMYDPKDGAKLDIGHIASEPDLPDLPRHGDVALIGDKRNDENAIVSQLQLAFLLAHNTLVDRARAHEPGLDNDGAYKRARRSLHWLYHHVVWNDFMPRVVNDEIYKCAMSLETACGGRSVWKLGLDDIYRWKNQPFMPVEFSVAAYRFGHSMVRNGYQTNNPVRGFGNFAPIFDNDGSVDPDDLRGFRPMKPENCIQWDWFLEMTSSAPGIFPQFARKIDTKLSNALAALHEVRGNPGHPHNVLAFLNLKRGAAFDLPSGADIARKWCLKPVELKPEEPNALWYYLLREAQAVGGNGLGRMGSIIVCAVFAGLLKGDPCSWVNLDPCWSPKDDPLLRDGEDNVDDPDWSLASIIRIAGLKADGIGRA